MNRLLLMNNRLLPILCVMFLLVSCNKEPSTRSNTLSDFTIQEETISKNKSIEVDSTKAEKAYKEYLSQETTKTDDRKRALQRLAEIKLDMKVSDPSQYVVKGDSTSISLFKRRLREFPNDKNNDLIMYQLANAYAISGDEDNKVKILERLVDSYQGSKYFVESMFRLGESYLSKGLFIDAELALTSVIIEDRTNKYKNNALFKRAWAKYKQLRYSEAITDYNELLKLYPGGRSSNRSDQEFLKNIYRVYSACIAYIGIDDSLGDLSVKVSDNQTRYHIYHNLAKFLIKQERHLDATRVYLTFIDTENTKYRNEVLIALSEVWKEYPGKEYSMDQLLSLENQFGLSANKFTLSDESKNKMAENLVYVSEYYHSLSQKKSKQRKEYSLKALDAYNLLISSYNHKNTAQHMFLYAELLQEQKQASKALVYYEKSVMLEKDQGKKSRSAFALLSLTNQLFFKQSITKQQYLEFNDKYLKNINKKHSYELLLAFSEYLYNEKQFEEAISYIEENSNKLQGRNTDKLKFILASSYFEIGEFVSSENTYKKISNMKKFTDINKRLALAIFKQAEKLRDKYLYEASIAKFDQIATLKLDRKTELRAQIDVSSIYMLLSDWDNAIQRLIKLRDKYPNSQFDKDITHKLSVAYLNNNQDKYAALEFEKIYEFTKDLKLKRTAIWQAAELYETGGDRWRSVKAYKKYIKQFKQPSSLYVEAMNKLSDLYTDLKLSDKRNYWLTQIIKYVRSSKESSDRMKYLASKATMIKARDYYASFKRVKLTVPLKVSLTKKKKVLKNTVSSLKKVNQYKMYDHVSESIFWMAETYYDFSKSLMSSERPKNLSELELEQYDVLLEDQAIPFEDQAIRYYLQNLQALKQGRYGKWVAKSIDRLSTIYPSKYRRKELVESHINQFH